MSTRSMRPTKAGAQEKLKRLLDTKGGLLRALRHPSPKPFARSLTLEDYARFWLDQGTKATLDQLTMAVKLIEERLTPPASAADRRFSPEAA